MHKSLLHTYYLIICLITTIIILITSGLIVSTCIDWKFPELKNSVDLAHYASNDKFLAFQEEKDPKKYAIYSAMSDEELRLVKNQAKHDHIVSIQSRAIENITRYAVWLLIGWIFFYIHWFFYRRSLR